MVTDIKQAFEDGLKYVSWMDMDTKKAAKEKVGHFHRKTSEMQHCHLL